MHQALQCGTVLGVVEAGHAQGQQKQRAAFLGGKEGIRLWFLLRFHGACWRYGTREAIEMLAVCGRTRTGAAEAESYMSISGGHVL